MSKINISFAGAGRVAMALCQGLSDSGFKIDRIASPSEPGGSLLAGRCNALWSPELIFPDSTKLIIVAVPDHSLKHVLKDIKCNPDTIVVHTAGSYGLDIFPGHLKNRGVFYPLQTFSHDRKISFTDLPFLLEASDDKSLKFLASIATSLGGKIYYAGYESRKMLHLAAVFACNFTNHMLTLGKSISSKAGFDFDILAPLIKETIEKAILTGPENSQTGPAVRHDSNTIEKQLELLSFSPEMQGIYREITRSIMDYYRKVSGTSGEIQE